MDKKAKYREFDNDSNCYLLENKAMPSIVKQHDLYFVQDNASIHVHQFGSFYSGNAAELLKFN